MKRWVFLVLVLLAACSMQAQQNASDTITFSGRISKIATLQKDWDPGHEVAGDKKYLIYWLEFTMPTAGMTTKPTLTVAKLPDCLVFASPSSGLLSELGPFKKFATNDSVVVTCRRYMVEQFLKGEIRNILIKNITMLK